MEISKYKVQLYRGNALGVHSVATITLWGTKTGEMVTLVFYDPDKHPTPPTSSDLLVYIPKDQYAWHLDLLRHESPVEFFVQPGSKEIILGTMTKEPVGENE